MAEYIERKIATNVVGDIDTTNPYDDKDDIIEKAIGRLDLIPTADVAPVVHARWNDDGRCTNCGCHAPFWCMASTYHESPFCFECGAKMDGGNEDG